MTERHTHRDRHTQRETDRHRHTERQTETHREAHREREAQRETHTDQAIGPQVFSYLFGLAVKQHFVIHHVAAELVGL